VNGYKKLTEKEQKFALEIADGKNRTDAALNAYDCTTRQSAKALGIQKMQNFDVQLAVSDIIDVGRERIVLWES